MTYFHSQGAESLHETFHTNAGNYHQNKLVLQTNAGVFEAHSWVSITPTRGEQKCADQDDSDVMLGLKSRRRGADLIHAWT